jgi:hypothetical protein
MVRLWNKACNLRGYGLLPSRATAVGVMIAACRVTSARRRTSFRRLGENFPALAEERRNRQIAMLRAGPRQADTAPASS